MVQDIGWLAGLVGKVLRPFAAKRVDAIASTIAVRRAVLRELVRLSADRYVREKHFDADKSAGICARVSAKLISDLDLSAHDPEAAEVRARIADMVTAAVVSRDTWAALKAIGTEAIPLNATFYLKYRDGDGSLHVWTRTISMLQEQFLFHKPFVCIAEADTSVAPKLRVSPDARALADAALADGKIEVLEAKLIPASSGAQVGVAQVRKQS